MNHRDSLCRSSSHQIFLFMVIIPELLGGAVFLPLEQAVEVREVVEAAIIAYFSNGLGGIHKHTGGIAKTDVDDVVGKSLARAHTEETTEGHGSHPHQVRQLTEPYLFLEVCTDVALNPLHATRLIDRLNLGKRGAGELSRIRIEGEVVKDAHKLHHGQKALLLRRKMVQPIEDLEDSLHGER